MPKNTAVRTMAAIAAIFLVGFVLPEDSASAGSVEGKITFSNGDPDVVIDMAADPNCIELNTEPVYTERIVGDGDGGLANVFIYVKDGLGPGPHPMPDTSALLDQKNCRYTPHVVGVMTGQKIVIRNSDPMLHNVHARPKLNREFNIAQPFEGFQVEKTFNKPEIGIPVRCDIHPWMNSYVFVLDHPYFAVTGPDGTFRIDDLPAGSYLVEALHERLGSKSARVEIGADGDVALELDFSPAD